MDYFCPEDIELLENAEIVNIMKKAQIFLNKEKMEIAKKGASKHNIDDITDYSKFLGFFGYVTEKEKNTDKKIIEFLENNLIDDEVYISSDSKNQWIRSYANRCGMTLDKFVEFFGYKKAKRNKYIELDEYYEGQIEEFRTKFQKIAVEGNKIRIEGNLYQTVHRFCKINSINIDDFVADLGYTRIKGKRVTDLDTRSDAIKRYQLQELKQSIDLTLEYNNKFYMDAKTLELKRKRNKNLVHQLKEIYGCKCQLCSNNLWMPIHKEDGSYYCEVHHIMGLAEENEEENLDVLENLIVVCPNHHKMLHYHNGGYKKITRKNNTLYFYNNSDEEIQIMDNYHLKEM